MSAASTLGQRVAVPELDVLRGIAAVLMILNHAGFRLLNAADASGSASGAAVFLGGFAPVIFFFATGFGIALSTRASAGIVDMRSVVWKAALLVLADQWIFWRHGVAGGLDFFGFTAIASVTLSFIAARRRPVLICVVLAVALLALRFVVGPALQPHLYPFDLWNWVTGVQLIDHISYPLSPWLVYPLIGFVLGWIYEPVAARTDGVRWRLVLAAALCVVAFAILSAVLARVVGSSFFRWGSVGVGFVALSFSVLAASVLLAGGISKAYPRFSQGLALRGVASFAVIPFHYAMLDLCDFLMPLPLSPLAYGIVVMGIIVAALYLSARFASFASRISGSPHRRAIVGALGVAVLVLSVSVVASAATLSDASLAVMTLVAQLLIAAILVVRPRAAPRTS